MNTTSKSLVSSLLLAVVAFASPVWAANGVTEITISGKADQNVFDKTKLSVKPGAKVKLTLKNLSKKGSGMQHNWVLVKPGKAAAVTTASISAGPDKGWVAKTDDVIAFTKLVDPEGEASVEFTAPTEKGVYPFICTFPGHAATMKGELTVK